MMPKTSAAIVEIEKTIAEIRDGRGPSRQGIVDILRRALDALWEQRCNCKKD